MFNDPPASPSGVDCYGALSPGARIDSARYLLKRKLGHGAWTEVWLARDVKWERDIALKFLPSKILEHATLLEQIDSEVRRSAQLAHPAIARVLQFICDREVAAIATEYVDGWSLAAIKLDKPQKRFQIEELNLWIHQICAALDYAHHGFCQVHRNLNPSNLLLNGREQLKITDFGIDHVVQSAAAEVFGSAYGKSAYSSPQQLMGREASVLDDIYSLGATLYDLLTGAPPFGGVALKTEMIETAAEDINKRLLAEGVEDLLPESWARTIGACLAKSPGQRPQSANDVLNGLLKEDPALIKNEARSSPRFPERLSWLNKAAPFCHSAWEWIRKRTAGIQPLGERMVNVFRRNPRLLLMAFFSLVAFNLGLALWFLFRR